MKEGLILIDVAPEPKKPKKERVLKLEVEPVMKKQKLTDD